MRVVYVLTGPPSSRAVYLPSWSEVTQNADGSPVELPGPGRLLIEVRDEDIPPEVAERLQQKGGSMAVLPPGLMAQWRDHLNGRYREHAGEYLP